MVDNENYEQLMLIKPPYRYIIDTCSILSQKSNEPYRRTVYKTLWDNIDLMVQNKIIITCSAIKDEIEDEEIITWLQFNKCEILDADIEIQRNVARIVNEHPELLNFANMKSSGDAFLIATAMKYEISIITEESKGKLKKIPKICEAYDIPCYSITEMAEKEGWIF